MKKGFKESRREFLSKSMRVTAGAAAIPSVLTGYYTNPGNAGELPGVVWIAGVSQMGLRAKTPGLMIARILEILGETGSLKPDFVCLPEVFPFTNVDQKTNTGEKVEISLMALEKISAYSRENNCYSICPVYTRRDGIIYNSAVMFDREGRKIGSYEKIHPTEGEVKEGYGSGPLTQKVISTEFGPVGIQICFDIEWDDGWTMLRRQGARIVFWPSAFPGGIALNTKAWMHKYVVASATNKHAAKLCDITGDEITKTGIWNPNVYCAPVNLEKAFIHTWPEVYKFSDLQKKYGRKIRITTFHEEEWSVLESLSPEIRVNDILKEFGIRTHEELIADSEKIQAQFRK